MSALAHGGLFASKFVPKHPTISRVLFFSDSSATLKTIMNGGPHASQFSSIYSDTKCMPSYQTIQMLKFTWTGPSLGNRTSWQKHKEGIQKQVKEWGPNLLLFKIIHEGKSQEGSKGGLDRRAWAQQRIPLNRICWCGKSSETQSQTQQRRQENTTRTP